MITLREAVSGLLEAVVAAIEAGDWKVDGACDPTVEIIRLKNILAKPQTRVGEMEWQLGYERGYERGWDAAMSVELTRQWQGLTHAQRDEIADCNKSVMSAIFTTETRLKEMNT